MRTPAPRSQLPLAIVVVTALVASACESEKPETLPDADQTRHRNILLVVIDTLRRDAVGVYAGRSGLTPAMDEFSGRAVVFDRAFSAAPWTCPSMASLFTSLVPERHGMVRHPIIDAEEFVRLPDEATTLAEILSRAGWRTHGLSENPWVSRDFGLAQGFDSFRNLKPEEHRLTDAALQALADFGRTSSFFLYVHYMDPHTPYEPPESFRTYRKGTSGERTLQRMLARQPDWWAALSRVDPTSPHARPLLEHLRHRYADEVRWVDSQVGELLEALKKRGLADHTAVAIVSDHGEGFGEHAMLHGYTLFNEELAIPMMLAIPWHASAAGTRFDGLVSTLDLAPTLLQAVGLEPPAGTEGRPLQLASGEAGPGREFVVSSSAYDRSWAKIRTATHALMIDHSSGTRLLFDLQADPAESRNLIHDQPDAGRKLDETLQCWLEAAASSPLARHETEVSPETLDQLRALGYADDPDARRTPVP
jgi:arylsulfatase A-like enzyme